MDVHDIPSATSDATDACLPNTQTKLRICRTAHHEYTLVLRVTLMRTIVPPDTPVEFVAVGHDVNAFNHVAPELLLAAIFGHEETIQCCEDVAEDLVFEQYFPL